MTASPLTYRWTGDSMEVLPRHGKLADQRFTIGQTYQLEVCEERSAVSHRHFFATVNEAWSNLPEREAERFATADHLRKWCLIKAGYRDERTLVAASKAEAQRLAAFIRPMDEYAVVLVNENVVTVYTAKSQSTKAMGKKAFQDSKDKVLDIIADMLGVEPDALAAHMRSAPSHRSVPADILAAG